MAPGQVAGRLEDFGGAPTDGTFKNLRVVRTA
jgi:hypothetical protein